MGSQQGKNKSHIIITGLDNSGKSTIIPHLKPRKYRRKLVSKFMPEQQQNQSSMSTPAKNKTLSSYGQSMNSLTSGMEAKTQSSSNSSNEYIQYPNYSTQIPRKKSLTRQILSDHKYRKQSSSSSMIEGNMVDFENEISIETFTKGRLGGDFVVFDLQSHNNRQRELWEIFYSMASSIVFVIDASDRLRIQVVKNELDMLLDHQDIKGKGQPIVFLANKIDKAQALDEQQIVKSLNLEAITDRIWSIRSCSAHKAEGIMESLIWLHKTQKELAKKSKRKDSSLSRGNEETAAGFNMSSGGKLRSSSQGRQTLKLEKKNINEFTNQDQITKKLVPPAPQAEVTNRRGRKSVVVTESDRQRIKSAIRGVSKGRNQIIYDSQYQPIIITEVKLK